MHEYLGQTDGPWLSMCVMTGHHCKIRAVVPDALSVCAQAQRAPLPHSLKIPGASRHFLYSEDPIRAHIRAQHLSLGPPRPPRTRCACCARCSSSAACSWRAAPALARQHWWLHLPEQQVSLCPVHGVTRHGPADLKTSEPQIPWKLTLRPRQCKLRANSTMLVHCLQMCAGL